MEQLFAHRKYYVGWLGQNVKLLQNKDKQIQRQWITSDCWHIRVVYMETVIKVSGLAEKGRI